MNQDHNSSSEPTGSSSDDRGEMDAYLQAYVEETQEELDALTEALVELEKKADDPDHLNEAFRLVHSMKGSSGLMGLATISELAHRWEDLLDRHRSGQMSLEKEHIDAMLRCVDAIRRFVERIRVEDALHDASPSETQPLIEELQQLLDDSREQDAVAKQSSAQRAKFATSHFTSVKLAVRFDENLQLPDLKAKLVVNRLSGSSEILAVDPDLEDVEAIEASRRFVVSLLTQQDQEEIRRTADVEGVVSIDFLPVSGSQVTIAPIVAPAAAPVVDERLAESSETQSPPEAARDDLVPSAGGATTRVAETVRVDINRLDQLMNLTGELIVNRERFQQLMRRLTPTVKKNTVRQSVQDMVDRIAAKLQANGVDQRESTEWSQCVELFHHCSAQLEEVKTQVSRVTDAVEQLSQISENIQRLVMETRMVPLAPLFNRFKRVVRDLADSTHKQVRLVIRGETTELDKRMVDELADPLVHLVRNAIDHGLGSPAERREAGKDETGTIALEASHRGNNVYIVVRDDGRGIDLESVRSRIIERDLSTSELVAGLEEQQLLNFVWRPGFSTAEEVTDISGRGVGMDIVRNRITDLCGTIEATSESGLGATFTIRLPLTLAIIPSLVLRIDGGLFSAPLDEVVEIAPAADLSVVDVGESRTVEVRNRFFPLISLDRIFYWAGRRPGVDSPAPNEEAALTGEIVILKIAGTTVALEIDEAVGVSELVIKSLADNFRPVHGLSGASILGDGEICLMLDGAALIELARKRASSSTRVEA